MEAVESLRKRCDFISEILLLENEQKKSIFQLSWRKRMKKPSDVPLKSVIAA